MKVGIYNNERICTENILYFCRQYNIKENKNCTVKVFQSGEELLQNREHMDIVFLGIGENGKCGLEMRERLWKTAGESCFVVYVTGDLEYITSAYDVNVIGFLIQPLNYDMIEGMLHKAEQRQRDLQVVYAGKERNLRARDILYVKAETPYVRIYLANEENYLERSGLSDIEKQLKEFGFCRIHHSYVVNMAYIWSYTKSTVRIYEKEVPVSRRRYRLFEKIYEEYEETCRGTESLGRENDK